MADEERKKSFWETLPGIITALAALLTGVAAVIAALNGGAKESAPQQNPPPAQVPVVQAMPVNLPSVADDAAQQAAEEAAQAKAEAAAALAREAEWKRKLAEAEQRATAENAARQAAAEEAAAAKARAEEAERRAAAVEAARKALEEQRLTQGRTIGQYIDHGDGTITDTKTGLMWKRCSEGLSGVNCEEGKAEEYKWDDAVQRFKNIEYAGYSDWRLPTIDELKTLVYCSNGTPQADALDKGCNKDYSTNGFEKPTVNQQAFPNTEAGIYWSGSPNAGYSDYAWYVYFYYGNSSYGYRDSYSAVRLVRGGQ